MDPRRIALVACLILALATASLAETDFLILTPGDLHDAADALARHRREEGLAVRVEVVDPLASDGALDPARLKTRIRALRDTEGERLRYLLLLGDAPSRRDAPGLVRIPPKILPPAYSDERWAHAKTLASDIWYGLLDDDLVPELEVGRLPADDLAEARALVDRIVDYETGEDFGAWRRDVRIVAGTAGFGPAIDAILEATFRRYVERLIPLAYDVTVTYASPASPYSSMPTRFPDKVVEQLDAGSLVAAYVGHSGPHAFGSLRWRDRKLPVFRLADARRVDIARGAPVFVVLACSAGFLDHPRGDCLAEVLLRRPRGPVAIIASTRISQPYADAIVGRELIGGILGGAAPRLGDAMRAARTALARPRGADQAFLDAAARIFMGADALAPCREDHVHLYGLFGDPTMIVARPRGRATIEAPEDTRPGETLPVTARLDRAYRGTALVSLEVPRGEIHHDLIPVDGLDGDDLATAMAENWRRANDLVLTSRTVEVDGDRLSVEFEIPTKGAPVGEAVLKVFARDPRGCALGARRILIRSRR